MMASLLVVSATACQNPNSQSSGNDSATEAATTAVATKEGQGATAAQETTVKEPIVAKETTAKAEMTKKTMLR